MWRWLVKTVFLALSGDEAFYRHALNHESYHRFHLVDEHRLLVGV